MRSTPLLVSLLSLGLAATACSQSETSSPAPAPTSSSAAVALPACTAADFAVEGAFGEKPKITVPKCAPSSELVSEDLTPGTGAEVVAGSTATVNYQLVTFSDGVEKDGSFDRGQTFDVENVGQAGVIDGWNEGLVGMKEGGRRLLVVPPQKGYGKGGNGIKPNETLVFVIDAVKVTPAA
ncbi:FKBP-type peptidyl-prolyl cis-trans isomerase [Umezawaea beigongshangensis]|uniref:FKBP-type peptidyl-prolyl cis-trans isomerase n=1 Tax=Umezawaea beigongshangensis TaxID=2780383 RepID=UPI0018F1F09C|nr:FKBP-type peptidyl-prolyl cis-trans isomerase [Umezawaea beigongshangensis]